MKINFTLTIFLILQNLFIFPVGAGLAIYRYNKQNCLEFLLVKDPKQKHIWRTGFEFPAGTIGDSGHRTIDQLNGKIIDRLSLTDKEQIPVECYLRGAIREALEELVFIPAKKLVDGQPYKNKKIDKFFQEKAINVVAEIIKQQGLICLRNVQGRSNYTIFFWNGTNIVSSNILEQIQKQRNFLLSGWFKRASSIGAEPDQFAWVSQKELEKVIKQAQIEKNFNKIKKSYFVVATELVQGNLPLQKNVTIQLSSAFVGLISRSGQNIQSAESMLSILKSLSI